MSTTSNKTDKQALYSKGNLHWDGVGSLHTGYNVVTSENAAKWLERYKDKVREASVDEVARELNR
jgi:hypothetical protein